MKLKPTIVGSLIIFLKTDMPHTFEILMTQYWDFAISGLAGPGQLLIFGSAVIVVVVAVGYIGCLVRNFRPIAVLIRFVSDDLFSAVGQIDAVLASRFLVLVSLAARLFVTVVVVNVKFESVVVPSLIEFKNIEFQVYM